MSEEEDVKIVSVHSGFDAIPPELCRLCAKRIQGEATSIFDDSLHESLEEFLGISIGASDVWPKSVCQKCVKKATKTIKFVRSIRKSEDVFKNLYGANGPVVEFVVTEVAGGVQQDFDEDSGEVEVISDDEVYMDDSVVVKEENEVFEDPGVSQLYHRLAENQPDAYPRQNYEIAMQNEENYEEEVLPAALAPRRRYKTDEDFRRVEAYYNLSCTYCFIRFLRLKELRAHYREMHQQEGYVLCCGKKLFRLTYMLDHMEYHSNPEAFKCDQCGKCVDSQLHLRTHQQQAHPGIYSRRKKVIERLSEATKQSRFTCPYCHREFDYKCAMDRHITQLHQGGTFDICGVCNKKFKCRISYQRHI
uniref:Uncharacterized protein n=2 Tax=Phlebotomus papatasi TaxID=29031 RepID=A0A1B0DMH1_PHLPP